MATGSALTPRSRESDPPPEDSGPRFRIGLTPVSLFLVLIIFWIMTQMGSLLITALMAILLGTLLEGPVRRIEERRVPRAAAIAIVYVLMIATVVALVFVIVPVVQGEFDTFQERFPETVDDLRGDWRQSGNALLSGPGVGFLDSVAEFFNEPTGSVGVSGETAEQAIPILTRVGGGLVSIITALVVTFYYLLEKRLIRRMVLDQLSPKHQQHVDRLWTSVEMKTGGWLRGQLVLCLIIGTLATTAYGIIGLSFWPLLGLWAGITEIIPIVGPWIGGVPAVIVAITEGWQTALIVGLVIVGMQSLENWFLVPRVMRGAVGLTPMTVFVAILAGTELMGLPGAVLAIPIAAGVQVVLTDLMDERRARMSTDPSQVSGWRWMLNRGMGRRVTDETPDEDDREEPQQVEGTESWGTGRADEDHKEPDRSPDEDEPTDPDPFDHRAEATWPANPWKGKAPTQRRSGTWGGTTRSSGGRSNDSGTQQGRGGSSTS